MTDTILILGGTGKTGRRLATALRESGEDVRTAARSGADAAFDWDDPPTHDRALDGAGRLYLVPPAGRQDFAGPVGELLDRAEKSGVRHVTYLSAHGVEHAPPEVAMRAVELDLAARTGLTHTVLRPAWFMQNFSEGAFTPMVALGRIDLPAGAGSEAFIDARDIADAAAASLRDPQAHAGVQYALTGPEALTFAEVADALGRRLGRPVAYRSVAAEQFVDGLARAGVPADYAATLAGLLEGISNGHGSRPGPGVQDATGRAPRSFARYAEDAEFPPAG